MKFAVMPLFMDLHKASDYAVKPTVEEIKRNHIADLAVQEKYHVRFLQYWINEEAGLVFCLMEGPDKESCAAVHREAHGDMPCNVIELKGGDYVALMGNEGKVNAFDIVERADGSLDSGYRFLLVADLIALEAPDQCKEIAEQIVQETGGRLVHRPGNRMLTVFYTSQQAIDCALRIINQIKARFNASAEVRIGISAGEPVTDQYELFGEAIQLANRLCDITPNGMTLVTPLVQTLTSVSNLDGYRREPSIKMLNKEDEAFMCDLLACMGSLLAQPGFSIDDLGKKLGMSRSQLYRKITGLTGASANMLIRELRMQKALQLLQEQFGNITQVALETGFTNPSYFAKNFQDRFGMSPLKVLKMYSE